MVGSYLQSQKVMELEMKRCKNCGAFEGTTSECLRIEATGPVMGKHAWQTLREEAPGPEHWMGTGAPERPSKPSSPPGYLTAERATPGALLDSRNAGRTITSQALLGQAPRPNQPYMTADVRQMMGMRRMGWHETIIMECAPICRKIRATEPRRNPKLPADVRSRGPRI